MLNINLFLSSALILILVACTKSDKQGEALVSDKPGTFGYDLNFLMQHDSVVVLKSGDAQVIVSPKYQAKVFTSTAEGLQGLSFGWINYKAFTAAVDPHMNAYGGENRFWLGPEGGIYSLYFEKGKDMVFKNWKTPAPIDTESWLVTQKGDQSVVMQKDMDLVNFAGGRLSLRADRGVVILDASDIASQLGIVIDNSVKVVGYATKNTITNMGDQAWDEETGMPCIWILDMFNPSPETVVIIPYQEGEEEGAIASTDYFGPIPDDRIQYQSGAILFKADGHMRGKLGVGPQRAKPIAGSYDGQNNVLTITLFDVDSNGKYLNQEWGIAKPPFSGDAVNAYNDGPLEDGSIMGPFYEIESVSPAALLKPGESLSHQHAVFHFTGNEIMLNEIAVALLGVSFAEVKGIFAAP